MGFAIPPDAIIGQPNGSASRIIAARGINLNLGRHTNKCLPAPLIIQTAPRTIPMSIIYWAPTTFLVIHCKN